MKARLFMAAVAITICAGCSSAPGRAISVAPGLPAPSENLNIEDVNLVPCQKTLDGEDGWRLEIVSTGSATLNVELRTQSNGSSFLSDTKVVVSDDQQVSSKVLPARYKGEIFFEVYLWLGDASGGNYTWNPSAAFEWKCK